MRAEEVISQFELEPLIPEGGFFKRSHTEERAIDVVRSGKKSQRPLSTAIYYLITEKSFSAWHKVECTEIYHYYGGSPSMMTLIHPDGRLERLTLGQRFDVGEVPQVVIPAGTWQATKIADPEEGDWTLFGATVTPGFDYADFVLGDVDELQAQFPQHASEIEDYLV